MANSREETIDLFEDKNTMVDEQIQPYMFEPNKGDVCESTADSTDDSSSSEDDSLDHQFEASNSWRRTTLEWCKCGKCAIMERTIESFCCHEKAIEYDSRVKMLSPVTNLRLVKFDDFFSFIMVFCSK